MSHVGDLLKERRDELGLNQKEVADLAGIPWQGYVSQAERGERYPKKHIKALCKVLGITDEELRTARRRDDNERRGGVARPARGQGDIATAVRQAIDRLSETAPPDRTKRTDEVIAILIGALGEDVDDELGVDEGQGVFRIVRTPGDTSPRGHE